MSFMKHVLGCLLLVPVICGCKPDEGAAKWSTRGESVIEPGSPALQQPVERVAPVALGALGPALALALALAARRVLLFAGLVLLLRLLAAVGRVSRRPHTR